MGGEEGGGRRRERAQAECRKIMGFSTLFGYHCIIVITLVVFLGITTRSCKLLGSAELLRPGGRVKNKLSTDRCRMEEVSSKQPRWLPFVQDFSVSKKLYFHASAHRGAG